MKLLCNEKFADLVRSILLEVIELKSILINNLLDTPVYSGLSRPSSNLCLTTSDRKVYSLDKKYPP